jgi:hypothetical protein
MHHESVERMDLVLKMQNKHLGYISLFFSLIITMFILDKDGIAKTYILVKAMKMRVKS